MTPHSLLGTAFVCRACQRQGIITGVQRIGMTTAAINLDCGHSCVTSLHPPLLSSGQTGDTMIDRGKEKICAACDESFQTFMDGNAIYEFCMPCRDALVLHTREDAQATLDAIDQLPVTQRKEIIEDMKKKRRSQGNWWARQPQQPARPPVDAARVREAMRAMIAYGDLAGEPTPEDGRPTRYVIAKNGLFEVRQTDIATIVLRTSDTRPVMGVDTAYTEGIRLNLPPLPFELLRQTVAFFRQVQKDRSGAEAFVRVWWNRAAQQYELRCPEQSVSGGGVHHTDNFDQEGSGEWLLVADIHSHNTMNAFWSGVDDADERKAPEGRICGVIGKITDTIPDWKWRMRTREGFIEMKLADVWAIPTSGALPFTVSWEVVLESLGDPKGRDGSGKLLLSCPVDPFHGATFPAEWMERVKGMHSGGHWRGHGGHSAQSGVTPWGGYSGGAHYTQFIYLRDPQTGKGKEVEVNHEGTIIRETGVIIDLTTLPRTH